MSYQFTCERVCKLIGMWITCELLVYMHTDGDFVCDLAVYLDIQAMRLRSDAAALCTCSAYMWAIIFFHKILVYMWITHIQVSYQVILHICFRNSNMFTSHAHVASRSELSMYTQCIARYLLPTELLASMWAIFHLSFHVILWLTCELHFAKTISFAQNMTNRWSLFKVKYHMHGLFGTFEPSP